MILPATIATGYHGHIASCVVIGCYERRYDDCSFYVHPAIWSFCFAAGVSFSFCGPSEVDRPIATKRSQFRRDMTTVFSKNPQVFPVAADPEFA